MKEFVKKMISGLEEIKSEVTSPADNVWNNAVKMCIDKTNELAEEYNNGWIPCSERLPEFPKNYEDEKRYLTTVRRKDGYVFWDMMVFHDYGWYLPSNCEVIAWKEVEPYQKGAGE